MVICYSYANYIPLIVGGQHHLSKYIYIYVIICNYVCIYICIQLYTNLYLLDIYGILWGGSSNMGQSLILPCGAHGASTYNIWGNTGRGNIVSVWVCLPTVFGLLSGKQSQLLKMAIYSLPIKKRVFPSFFLMFARGSLISVN